MNFKKNLSALITVGLCASGVMAGASLADEGGEVERAIEYRQAVMTILGRNTNLMGAMMKEQLPYDQKTFTRLAKDLDAAANLDLLAGFPKGSINDESDAKSDIWRNVQDFEQKYYKMQSASNDVKLAAESGDPAKIKPIFFSLAKACKECHKAYRE